MVLNVHERRLAVPIGQAGAILDSLGTDRDLLWPHEDWPPFRSAGPLAVGVPCRHGPVRYVVEVLDPGRAVVFRFRAPEGFEGTHGFTLTADGDDATRLRHTLILRPKGRARFTWPLIYRPLHDALMEDAFDKAERSLGTGPAQPSRWSTWVKTLRKSAGLAPKRG